MPKPTIDIFTVQSFRQRLLDQRDTINQVLDGLEKMFPTQDPPPAAATESPAPPPPPPARSAGPRPRSSPKTRRHGKSQRVNPLALPNLRKVGWKLPEAFTMEDMRAIGHFPKNSTLPNSCVATWKRNGWIKEVSRGEFAKTVKFPEPEIDNAPAAPEPSPAPVAPPPPPAAKSPEIHVPRDSETAPTERAGTISATDASAMKIAGELELEFKVNDLAALLGDQSPARAYRWISEWSRRNWIAGVPGKYGTYAKTTKFGNG